MLRKQRQSFEAQTAKVIEAVDNAKEVQSKTRLLLSGLSGPETNGTYRKWNNVYLEDDIIQLQDIPRFID